MPNSKDVAIIGMSGVFPEADDLGAFYENLKTGRDSVRPVSETRLGASSLDMSLVYRPFAYLERTDTFDHKYFRISKSEAEMMEPSQRLCLEMAVKAIEHAGYKPEDLNGSNTAVYLACRTWAAIQYYLLANYDDNPNIFTGTLSSMIYGRISNWLNLQGPTMMIDAACASSLIAVTEAYDKLVKGDIDYAIAGGLGININLAKVTDHGHLGTYSPEARCKAFDASADGVVPGEGGGLILMKRLEDAIRDHDTIYAIVKGGASAHNGNRSNGILAPSPQAQSLVIQQAWKNADVDPATIGYIEAHGTGTKLGDPIEFSAITEAFEKHGVKGKTCAVGALKSNIGHLGSGAGIGGIIKAVLSLKNKELFPSLHFNNPNPYIDFENTNAYVNDTLQDWKSEKSPRRCGVSAFGLSGTNAHIILEEYENTSTKTAPEHYLLKVSAKSVAALKQYTANISSFLKGINDSWADALYTLNRGRSDYDYRVCFTADSKEALLQQLNDYTPASQELTTREIILLLGNSGLPVETLAAYNKAYPVFAATFNSLCPGFPAMQPEEDMLVFATKYALCKQLQAFGIKFPVVIGAGIGKYVSRVLRGELTLEAVPALLKEDTERLPADKDKFRAIVKNLLEKKAPLFLGLGTDLTMTDLLKDWAIELDIRSGSIVSHPGTQGDLITLLSGLYNNGVAVDWDEHYAGKVYQKVECPVYPFEKTRCWFTEPTWQKKETVNDWYYKLHWTPLAAKDKSITSFKDRLLLVFTDNEGVSDALITLLEEKGNRCVRVSPGNEFEMVSDKLFRVNYTEEKDYRLLSDSLHALYGVLDGIIYLSGFFKPMAPALTATAAQLQTAFYGLFNACKTFSKYFTKTNFNLAVLTANVHAVVADDAQLSPVAALTPGMIKASLAEYYTLRTTCVDVDGEKTTPQSIATLLWEELSGDEVIRFVAYRNGKRYVQELNRVDEVQQTGNPYQLEQQGVYLVTGGHSGIGYEMATALATRAKATLLIIGRRSAADVAGQIAKLEQLGSKVHYFTADISNESDMQTLFADIKKRFSRLAGVIHSAGIGSSGVAIEKRNIADVNNTFAPKVQGSILLEEHTRSLQPGFFVVFSSIGALVPASSSADYSAANIFQDAFAAYWRNKGRNFISINWPDWKETGLSYRKTLLQSAEEVALRYSYLSPITSADGIEAFFSALSQRQERFIVVKADFRNFIINPYFKIGTIKKLQGEEQDTESNFAAFIEKTANGFSPTELQLAGIWHEVLKLDQVRLEDDFYELGGHSLNIIRMLNRIEQQMNVTLPIEELLRNSTLGGIAAHIDAIRQTQEVKVASDIPRIQDAEYTELSHAQLRFWLLHQPVAGREAYNVPTAYRLKGKVDINALRTGLSQFVNRHESLRTVFTLQKGVPVQKVLPLEETGFSLHVHDLRDQPDAAQLATEKVREAAGKAFDLATGPVIQAYLYQVADEEYIFMIVLHHISSDGRSMEILRNEVLECYSAALQQQTPALPALNIHYKDYAAWQNERIRKGYFDAHKAYWKDRLRGVQPISLEKHFDYPRPIQENFEAAYNVFFLPADITAQLKALGNNSTLFINTLLIYQILLAAYADSTDIVVGTPVGGREHTDLENQIGNYLNTLLLYTKVDQDLPFNELLEKVKEQVFKDYTYQAYPFDILVDELKLRDSMNVFETGFTWNTRLTADNGQSLDFEIEEYATGFNKAKADIWLHVTELNDGLQIGFLYKTSIFKDDTILLLSQRFRSLIEQCIQNPAVRTGDLCLDIATETETVKDKIAFDFNF
ncbi:SDR family NAD(P)-dependent oxidoreductase [Chitinophaga pinensis]|uniref:Erythronolide synthase, Aspartate racemase n=1 Tax=Chitinophaga pinensis (strain ATCC 43595 / DSM 2588 / LMG 13176 / NBRC 15968 / NCIMB 11800 / UQM 2034) TaxID=485918 RepID=A0A979GPX2_CHIPD|nr:SDR family NAD(P)-dependent oxidoreductase [Chitinophaga pinensis]ACU60877.1 erythronolide synthase, Aspartate racemase [Chitinophaga pinensis DSM 2588]